MDGTGDANFANTKKRGRSSSVKGVKRFKGANDGYNPDGGKLTRDQSGIRDPKTKLKIKTLEKKMQRKKFGGFGKAGESDRKITTKMPKHLFAGKRGNGKTQRR